MSGRNVFNIETADLSLNMVLEASAGTGKTYSLEHLFVRYILESGLSVKEILVVTFTEKAASELKKRIKMLLRKELSLSEEQLKRADPKYTSSGEKYQILKNALYEFSEVPVFTIHGFCQNCLSGFPVESGLPFDFKIMESDSIYEETVMDYFRTLDVKNNDEYLSFRSGKSGFDNCIKYFVNLLKKGSMSDGAEIYPDEDILGRYEKFKTDFFFRRGKLYSDLQMLKEFAPDEELLASVSSKLKLRINAAFRPLLIDLFNSLANAQVLSDFFCGDLVYHYGRVSKLTLTFLEKNESDLSVLDEREYRFVSLVDSVFSLPEGFCFDEGKGNFPFHDVAGSAFILKSMKILNENLYIKKMKNSRLDFSDLIRLTHAAVNNASDARGNDFREEIRRKYKIVMIDEFQDTDNLQWEIFNALFRDNEKRLVLIGDPKQSIYRFRGADIEVYFKALDEMKNCSISYILETNYRSEKRVVEALNKIFKGVFSLSSGGGHAIDFSAVKYPEEKEALLKRGGVEFLAVENDSKFRADEIASTIEALFASEIKELVESGSAQASDICILMESNDKCRKMYKYLVSLDIPAVYEGDTDLFESDEIHAMLDFLSAVASPLDRGGIIKTLISPLFDFQLSELPQYDDDYAFEKLSASFFKWKDAVDSGQFSSVLDEITGSEDLFPVLSGSSKSPFLLRRIGEIGGERVITNFEHIGEILVNRNRSKRENSAELLAYIISVMEGAEHEDEKLARLERDDKSVRIMTMHKSKGLEFPVVFFGGGFAGDSLPTAKEDYYEFVEDGIRKLDLVKNSDNKIKHYYDQWEERKRLYYVAFTRACQKLYLPVFRRSNLYYLTDIYGSMVFDKLSESLKESGICPEIPFAVMSPPGKMKKEEFTDIVSEAVYDLMSASFNDGEIFTFNRDLYRNIIENGIEPLSKIRTPVSEPAGPSLVFRAAEGAYDNKNISFFSYSSIVRSGEKHLYRNVLPGENTPGEEEQLSVLDEKDILKGPLFGNLMHMLLEKADYKKILDFEDTESMSLDEDIMRFTETVSRQFLPHGRIHSSLPAIADLLYKTIHASFSLPGKSKTLFIGQLEKEVRRHELEFLLKIKKGKGRGLLNLPSLNLDNGYIRGFIDLIFMHEDVFYIADWKTNYLGKEKGSYRGEGLKTAMEEHNYYLQMELYMCALARIISVRNHIPLQEAAEMIGGCYYFFLRGLDNEDTDSGVYFSPPDISAVLRFSDTFFEDLV